MRTLNEILVEIFVIGVPLLFYIVGYLITPMLLIWSWARFVRLLKQWTFRSILSLAGLAFATASTMTAISAYVYSRSIGGFPRFDNSDFMQMFRLGTVLSWVGIALGIAGLWRTSAARWHVLLCTLGTQMFWAFTGGD